jgi:hypothetical protein
VTAGRESQVRRGDSSSPGWCRTDLVMVRSHAPGFFPRGGDRQVALLGSRGDTRVRLLALYKSGEVGAESIRASAEIQSGCRQDDSCPCTSLKLACLRIAKKPRCSDCRRVVGFAHRCKALVIEAAD